MAERIQRGVVDRALLMRDVMDGELQASDRMRVGRVGDVRIAWSQDTHPNGAGGDRAGAARAATIVLGPEALAGRIHWRFRALLHRVLGGRWERELALDEVEELGPTLRLRRPAKDYSLASGERWIGEHVIRHLPGAGEWPPARPPSAPRGAASRSTGETTADAAEPRPRSSSHPAGGTNGHEGPDSRPSFVRTPVQRDTRHALGRVADVTSVRTIRGADLIGASVRGPRGEGLGDVLDVELRPKDDFALESLIVAKEPAIARLVLLRQVGPRPDRPHTIVPWRLVGSVDRRTIGLTRMPEGTPDEQATTEGMTEAQRAAPGGHSADGEGEAHGATEVSAVGERARADAAPADEGAVKPERRERRRHQ
jgi:sporulation protein YlmC with PRC-barrel domain